MTKGDCDLCDQPYAIQCMAKFGLWLETHRIGAVLHDLAEQSARQFRTQLFLEPLVQPRAGCGQA